MIHKIVKPGDLKIVSKKSALSIRLFDRTKIRSWWVTGNLKDNEIVMILDELSHTLEFDRSWYLCLTSIGPGWICDYHLVD